jgi:hypothetical protein
MFFIFINNSKIGCKVNTFFKNCKIDFGWVNIFF